MTELTRPNTVNVRLDKKVHATLRLLAFRRKTTISEVVALLLRKGKSGGLFHSPRQAAAVPKGKL